MANFLDEAGLALLVNELKTNLDDFKGTQGLDYIYYDLNYIASVGINQSTVLTEIVIPKKVKYNGNTYIVTSIGYSAFANCSGLTSVTIPDGITIIGSSAFENCSGLTNVTIGNGVTSIESAAFYNCSGLTSITIPDGVTSIVNHAFENCTGLTSITMKSPTPPALGTESFPATVVNIYVPYASVSAYKSAVNWSVYADKISADPYSFDTKVDKIEGKGLSTNDFTTAEKNRLATDNLRITELEQSLKGYVLDTTNETHADLDKAVLPNSITVDNVSYPIANNTRALLSEVDGKTQQFNQLLNKNNYQATRTVNGVTFTNNGDGTITANGTATVAAHFSLNSTTPNGLISSHKYLIKGCPSGGAWGTRYAITVSNNSASADVGAGKIFTGQTDLDPYCYVWSGAGAVTNLIFKPQLYDLTAMGLDSITTVAEFTAIFPNELYEYNAGTLYSSTISAVKLYETDGTTETGTITLPEKYTLNGAVTAKDQLIITKNINDDYYTLKKITATESGTILPEGATDYITDGNGNYVYAITPVETVISSTLTYAQVMAIRQNGGQIEVIGNDNVIYVKPTVIDTVSYQKLI